MHRHSIIGNTLLLFFCSGKAALVLQISSKSTYNKKQLLLCRVYGGWMMVMPQCRPLEIATSLEFASCHQDKLCWTCAGLECLLFP